jgi:putative ABC transport system permease protein
MIQYFLQTQFQRVQREDMSITFLKPLPEGAIRELSKVQGVLEVEGYRSVPIKMVFKNHKREMALTGFPADAKMIKKLDTRYKPIEVPSDGVLLSRFFAKRWDMRVGDAVSIEILEGAPRRTNLTVTGFSDDLVGLTASMQMPALWKILNEQPVYNVANLKVDSLEVGQTYVKLKGFPQIATVTLKQQLYQGFQKSMGGMIRLSTMILIIFALLIAVGVIYNSVRVSFSERSWEMATLRVLGFGKDSVFGMLATEVVVQVLFAIVPGCVMGWGLVHLSMRAIHTESFGFPVVINPETYAMSILIMVIALIGSILVVFKMIGKLSLIEALKVRE